MDGGRKKCKWKKWSGLCGILLEGRLNDDDDDKKNQHKKRGGAKSVCELPPDTKRLLKEGGTACQNFSALELCVCVCAFAPCCAALALLFSFGVVRVVRVCVRVLLIRAGLCVTCRPLPRGKAVMRS